MFRCEHCDIIMTGAEPYKTHIEGKKHLKKLKALGLTSVLGTTTTGSNQPDVKSYSNATVKPKEESKISTYNAEPVNATPVNAKYSTEPVSAKYNTEPVNAAQILGTSNTDPVMNAVKANLLGKLPLKRAEYKGKCDVCNVEFTSKSHEEQHLSGKKHKKKVQAKEAKEGANATTFFCGFCNVQVNSVEQMNQHRSGTAHNKKVASARKAQQETQQGSPPPHSAAKKKFVPSSGTEVWDNQIMSPPPVPPPILQPLTYDK